MVLTPVMGDHEKGRSRSSARSAARGRRSPPRPARGAGGRPLRVAAIDIGSNSIRLLIADVQRDAEGRELLRVIVRAGEPCRLARGLARDGAIETGMAERAAAVAREFATRARSLGATHLVIGATAALRQASNAAQVAAAIETAAGAPVRVLSGDEEARLVYRSVVHALGRSARGQATVVFDLGGGSTEIVSGVGSEPGRWVSLPIGAVNLTDRFLHSDPPAPEEAAALRAAIRELLTERCAAMPARVPLLAGVGGTVTVLGALDRQLATYDPAMLEGWTITAERLAGLIRRLVETGRELRGEWPVMGEGRADIIAAGALVVDEIFRRFPSGGLVCSTQGLRFGLARLAADEAFSKGAGQD
jgi:exopolyphosphatase/guanosine-5'-triphosphate,3'-diphosphate pyrophosphatase